MFPTGVTHITSELAFEKKDGCITYFNGHMPVFTHGEKDVATFRMITSQFCVSGYAKQSDITGLARGAGTFAGCGGSEHGLSVGLEMMPLMWRAAAARVRPASRGHRPRR